MYFALAELNQEDTALMQGRLTRISSLGEFSDGPVTVRRQYMTNQTKYVILIKEAEVTEEHHWAICDKLCFIWLT